MAALLKRFLNEEGGTTAIEYALIAVLLVIGIISGAGVMGQGLIVFFDKVSGGLAPAP